jgi:hypothetical protein
VRRLRQFGFQVPPKRSPPWARDEVILVIPESRTRIKVIGQVHAILAAG